MTTVMSGDVQDALYNIFTSNGDQGKELLTILGKMDSKQIKDTSNIAALLGKRNADALDSDDYNEIEKIFKRMKEK